MYYLLFLLLTSVTCSSLYSMFTRQAVSCITKNKTYYNKRQIAGTISTYNETRDKEAILTMAKKYQTKLSSYPIDKNPLFDEWFLQEIEATLKDHCSVYLLDNKPIGFITYSIKHPWYKKYFSSAKSFAYMHHFTIDTNHQNKGYGQKLFKEAIQHCKKCGASEVKLRTINGLDKSLNRFYEKQGFFIHARSKYSMVAEWKKIIDNHSDLPEKE